LPQAIYQEIKPWPPDTHRKPWNGSEAKEIEIGLLSVPELQAAEEFIVFPAFLGT
jgi:hypothetical protein